MVKLAFQVVIVSFLFLLSGCGGEEESRSGGGKFGMMEGNTAEFTALDFFDSIYNKQDINAAIALSSPKMARLLKSYRTPKAAQRHIIGLRYDGEVTMQLDSGDSVGRQEFATKSEVSIFLTGLQDGSKFDELRTIKLLRIKKRWMVDDIKADKFL